ncbi:serine hydrolase [Chitinophaga qingshengii]|uniref:beta-lactamase n=1 Tax=Chitinophaga qingshengii TaxID=1569794 RepID=A0ABR7THZ4_9BACT|nr:serine hydrolase [Chitinophaga qingshengii]MBC9929610.1 serine hydrolase [Chitinophaga qingshengii]
MQKIFLLLLLVVVLQPVAAQQTDRKLYNILAPLLAAHHGVAGVYVHHLKTGNTVAINADSVFPTASMVKMTIQAGIFDQLRQGKLQYRQLLTYRDTLLYPGDDILGAFKDGQQITLDKVMMLMLTMSDNTASLWLQSLAGGGAQINAWLEANGFKDTRVNSRTPGRQSIWEIYGWGQTTPREMATLMERIYKGEVVSRAASERMYRNLTRNFWDSEGLRMVPPDIRTASKNGAVDASRSEVILVNAPHGDYVYCIITKNNADQRWDRDNEAWELLRKVGGAIWQHYEPNSKWKPDPGSGQF